MRVHRGNGAGSDLKIANSGARVACARAARPVGDRGGAEGAEMGRRACQSRWPGHALTSIGSIARPCWNARGHRSLRARDSLRPGKGPGTLPQEVNWVELTQFPRASCSRSNRAIVSCNSAPFLLGIRRAVKFFFNGLSHYYPYACSARSGPAADFSRAFEGACFVVLGWRKRRRTPLNGAGFAPTQEPVLSAAEGSVGASTPAEGAAAEP